MSTKLDLKDKRILYELDRDARQPLSKIAKKVGLSRESILYRLKQYLEEGLIRNYLTVIDLAKLGFTHYKIYVKLHNITETQEKELINNLCSDSYISWVASCDGRYSLIFGVKARTLVELNNIIKRINNQYWQFFMGLDITSIISAYHFYRDYLIGGRGTTERKIQWGGEKEEIKLDAINIEILDKLSNDLRVTAVEIAKKLNISPDSILQRIKQLEKSGIIEHYMIWPNVNKLKGVFYKVLVSLHNFDESMERRLISYCSDNPNIVYIVNTLGPWQFEMDIEVEDLTEFRDLIRKFLATFSDIVSDYTTLNIYEEYKFRFFEKEILGVSRLKTM